MCHTNMTLESRFVWQTQCFSTSFSENECCFMSWQAFHSTLTRVRLHVKLGTTHFTLYTLHEYTVAGFPHLVTLALSGLSDTGDNVYIACVAGTGHSWHCHFTWQGQYLVQAHTVRGLYILRGRRSIDGLSHSTLYTPHSTLYTWHSTLLTLYTYIPLNIPNSTLYTPHCTLYTLHSYTLHFALYTLHFTLYTPHSTLALYTLHFTTLHTLHLTLNTLNTLHFTLPTVHFTLYTLYFALHTLHFTLDTWHSSLYTLHSTLYTLVSLYTPHSTLYALH